MDHTETLFSISSNVSPQSNVELWGCAELLPLHGHGANRDELICVTDS